MALLTAGDEHGDVCPFHPDVRLSRRVSGKSFKSCPLQADVPDQEFGFVEQPFSSEYFWIVARTGPQSFTNMLPRENIERAGE